MEKLTDAEIFEQALFNISFNEKPKAKPKKKIDVTEFELALNNLLYPTQSM